MPRRLLSLSVAGVLAASLAVGTPGAGAARQRPFASGIPEPANLAFDPRGGLWVASGGHMPARSNGVWYVRRAGAEPVHAVRGLFSALGLTWSRGRLFVAHIVPRGGGHVGRVTSFTGFDGRAFRRSRVVVDGLPVGRHRLGSIVAGPGRRLYLGVGSQYDARASGERLSGTVVSFRADGSRLRVEATGLRNPYGLAFLPGTSELLVSDHGRDDLGLRDPPEELDMVDVAKGAPDFGFPDCFGQGGPACRGTRRPLLRMAAHAAPGAVAVVRHSATRATVYVPRFGSSFADQPTGGDVVSAALTRRAGPWRARSRRLARGLGLQNPLGAAIGPDGRLYVSLWTRGSIVRFDLPAGAAQRPTAARRSRLTAARRPPAPPRPAAARPSAALPAYLTSFGAWTPSGLISPR